MPQFWTQTDRQHSRKTNHEQHRRDQQDGHGCYQKACAEQQGQHGSVDRMSNDTVGTGAHKLVVCIETGIDSPLAAKGARTSPGKESGKREEKQRTSQTPKAERSCPETVLPQKRIGQDHEQDTPTRTWIEFLRCGGISLDQEEWNEPD